MLKQRKTWPPFATCTSPIMHLICPPPPPQKILRKNCFQFLLGQLSYTGKMKNKGYAKCWGTNKVHYGGCASSE